MPRQNDNHPFNSDPSRPEQMPTVNASRRAASGEPGSVRMPGASGTSSASGMPGAGAASAAAAGTAGQARPSNARRNVIIVVAILVVAIAVWLLLWLFACNGSSLFDPNAQTGQAPYKTDEEIQAELDRVVEEGMFNIAIASTIEFEDGTSEGTAYIENVPGNHYNMQVTITEDATGDVLYESGVLAPNQYIEKIALAKDLDPGTYEATATFHALDTTTFDEVGQAQALVSMVVVN